VGGDLFVSRDALASLEDALAPFARDRTAPQGDEIARLVDGALAAPGVVIDGVRSLTTVTGVITRALGSR
jgi:hypothetical protein